MRDRIVDLRQCGECFLVVSATLDSQGPLPDLWQHDLGFEHFVYIGPVIEALESSRCDDHSVKLANATKPRCDVSSQLDDLYPVGLLQDLHTTTNRSGPHRRSVSQRSQLRTDEHISRVRSLRHRSNHEAIGGQCGKILRGVHGEVRPTIENSGLHLFDEHALAADLVQRRRLVSVTGGRDDSKVRVNAGSQT